MGASGRLLKAVLLEEGIDFRECFVTNIMQTRPPNNNFGSFYHDSSRNKPTDLLLQGINRLHQELREVKPNCIIACGAEPLKALTDKRGIQKWRGSVLWSSQGKVIACNHPSAVLRSMDLLPIFKHDVSRALEESISPILKEIEFDFKLNPTFTEVMKWLEKRPEKLSFDIETQGERVRCIALANTPRSAICIPFSSNPTTRIVSESGKTIINFGEQHTSASVGSHWTLDQEWEILSALDSILTCESVKKIAQNFKFDATHLATEFGIMPGPLWMDTLLAQHACYMELPKNLDFLTSLYTKIPRYSDHNPAVDMEEWKYNCMDACVTFEVAERLDENMTELGMWDFYRDTAQPLMHALSRIGKRGVKIDVHEREAIKKDTEAQVIEAQKTVNKVCGFELNPNSPKQMKIHLYETLALPKQMKWNAAKRCRTVTADEDALYNLSLKYPKHKPFFDAVLDYRGAVKTRGYLDSRLDHRGNMTTSYRAEGTKNGRISSATTLFGYGENLQQVRKGPYRRMYIAPPGYVFIKADLSQAEARATAWFAKIYSLIKRFVHEPGFDIHRFNAAIIYGVHEEDVTKAMRTTGKMISHGSNYMIGPRQAAQASRLPFKQVQKGLERIRAAIPELEIWWQETERECNENRFLEIPSGRKRIVMGRVGEHELKSYISFRPQGTIGDQINKAITVLELEKADDWHWPCLQVHDEIDMICKDDEACIRQCVSELTVELEKPIIIPPIPEPLIIPADVEIGPNWWDTEEYDDAKEYEGRWA